MWQSDSEIRNVQVRQTELKKEICDIRVKQFNGNMNSQKCQKEFHAPKNTFTKNTNNQDSVHVQNHNTFSEVG